MKNTLVSTFGLIVLVMVAFAPRSIMAGTANGAFYASPSWDQKLNCTTPATCPRFVVLLNWNSAAVLDKETGLVWERSPSTEASNWYDAQAHCNALSLGNRLGWRLPTIQELASLVDASVVSAPPLPHGNPFQNVQLFVYWSANTQSTDINSAWWLNFNDGGVAANSAKTNSSYVWCVRGGQGVDPQ
jgi:hypothetical protein